MYFQRNVLTFFDVDEFMYNSLKKTYDFTVNTFIIIGQFIGTYNVIFTIFEK